MQNMQSALIAIEQHKGIDLTFHLQHNNSEQHSNNSH